MPPFTNNLIHQSSPYLLQHAHNPVNWYPWAEEALQKAKQEDKPILVSIGYAACHWCHVMEKESFEDEQTAKLMNDNFINIKIDREERPDLDHIYMDAVQAISGSGGWPLNVFLTPEKKPFYGGTYFPPKRAFNRASWEEVLIGVSQLFRDKRKEVEAQAEELTQHIEKTTFKPKTRGLDLNISGEDPFTRQQSLDIITNIFKSADKKWGGFGNAPKFPQTFTIKYLLRYYHYTKEEEALKQACLSLDKMIEGGIYDQIGGGLARYSTDQEWLAPHFEKMLYDNALLIDAMCEAYQVTKNELYKRAVVQTIDFIQRELSDKNGGFYSSLDADSEGEEGKYYVWDYDEIKNILQNDAGIFCEFYNVSQQGNWEHKNILRVLVPLAEFAKQKNISEIKLEQLLKTCSQTLLEKRIQRVHPQLDDKILLGWNALMITSLTKAAAVFSLDHYKDLAVKNFEFLFRKFKKGEGFECYHTYKNGEAKYPAFLDDYACLIQSCISLQEVTSDTKYLEYAKSLTEHVLENFGSTEDDYFFYTGKDQRDVIVRKKEIYDGATPSGNSTMAANLFYLSIIFNNSTWKQKAINVISQLSDLVTQYPTSFANWACILLDQFSGTSEIAICGKGFEKLRGEILGYFIPGKVLQSAAQPNENYPLLGQKKIFQEHLIYLCSNYSCQQPVTNSAAIVNQIVNNSKFR